MNKKNKQADIYRSIIRADCPHLQDERAIERDKQRSERSQRSLLSSSSGSMLKPSKQANRIMENTFRRVELC
jgi:hypothetical protein